MEEGEQKVTFTRRGGKEAKEEGIVVGRSVHAEPEEANGKRVDRGFRGWARMEEGEQKITFTRRGGKEAKAGERKEGGPRMARVRKTGNH